MPRRAVLLPSRALARRRARAATPVRVQALAQALARASVPVRARVLARALARARGVVGALVAVALVATAPACRGPRGTDTRALADDRALGPYSGSVLAGDLVFVSGKIGIAGGGERPTSFRAEVHAALDAVAAELARADLTLGHVVSATVYLTDMALYGELNAAYAERLQPPYPARACVAVAALPAGARVEIQVVARRR